MMSQRILLAVDWVLEEPSVLFRLLWVLFSTMFKLLVTKGIATSNKCLTNSKQERYERGSWPYY